MSKFLHHDATAENDTKTTAVPWVFSENSRAKNRSPESGYLKVNFSSSNSHLKQLYNKRL